MPNSIHRAILFWRTRSELSDGIIFFAHKSRWPQTVYSSHCTSCHLHSVKRESTATDRTNLSFAWGQTLDNARHPLTLNNAKLTDSHGF